MKFRYDKSSEELVITSSTRIEYHQISLWLTRKIKNWRFNPKVKLGLWDGSKSFFKSGRVNLGLWKECLKACQEIGSSFILENKEDFPINREVTLESVKEFCKDFFKDHKVQNKDGKWVSFFPYDHQIESAFKILKNRYCLAEVATSGGKTLMISIVYFYTLKNIDPNAKLLIIVPSISLVSQFFDNICDFNIGTNINFDGGNKNPTHLRIQEIMSDRPRKHGGTENPNVFIGTYQSLEKYPKEFFEQFHTVCVDESHGAKSKTLVSILERTFGHAYSRFGVSGTFPPDDSCEILTIESLLGPKIAEVSASELKEKGIIAPMEVKVLIMNHQDSNMENNLKIARKGGMGKESYELEKKFIHKSKRRLESIKKIVEKCDSNTLLLFYTIEYGHKIFNKLKSEISDKDFYYIDGTIGGKEREKIKNELEKSSDRPKVLCASFGTLAVGVSIKNLHYLIMCDSFKSEQIVVQSVGRLLRLHEKKDKATIFDLVDIFSNESGNILYKHYLERRKMYKKREYPYKEIKINL